MLASHRSSQDCSGGTRTLSCLVSFPLFILMLDSITPLKLPQRKRTRRACSAPPACWGSRYSAYSFFFFFPSLLFALTLRVLLVVVVAAPVRASQCVCIGHNNNTVCRVGPRTDRTTSLTSLIARSRAHCQQPASHSWTAWPGLASPPPTRHEERSPYVLRSASCVLRLASKHTHQGRR